MEFNGKLRITQISNLIPNVINNLWKIIKENNNKNGTILKDNFLVFRLMMMKFLNLFF
jgi:hypothetical protein